MEKIKCPICGSNNSKPFLYLKDRFKISNNQFSLVRCTCDFIYLNPRPNEKEISKYYKNLNYASHYKVNYIYNGSYPLSSR